MAEKRKALTEDELLARLRVRYCERSGNGQGWAFIPKVRSAAAWDAKRTIDALAMNLWPSRGLELIAFEIKSSRSDWQRELRDPSKAEEFCRLVDRFYLVVGDRRIVADGELPSTWGLLVPHGSGLKVQREAPLLHELSTPAGDRARELPEGFNRSFLAALLRSATAVGGVQPHEIREAVTRAVEAERRSYQAQLAQAERRVQANQLVIDTFQKTLGIEINSVDSPWRGYDATKVAAALKLMMDGEDNLEQALGSLRRMRSDVRRLSAQLDELVAGYE